MPAAPVLLALLLSPVGPETGGAAETVRRPPFRTAIYVKPAGDRPIWEIERNVRRVPETHLIGHRSSLRAPRPE